MQTALLGVAAFLVVILALVSLLMVARSKLVNSADVKIIINGDEKNPLVHARRFNIVEHAFGTKDLHSFGLWWRWNLRCL